MNLNKDSSNLQKLLIRPYTFAGKHPFLRESSPRAPNIHALATRSLPLLNHSRLDSWRVSQLIKTYVERGPMRKRKFLKRFAIGCGGLIGILIVIGIIGALTTPGGNAQQITSTPTATSATLLAVSTPTPAATTQPTISATTAPTVTPTAQPTHQVTPTPHPTQRPTPKPTPRPTQPPCQSVNNNPWCYNFSPGNLIYNPPSSFCGYFACVSTFWSATNGYVAECSNGDYTHSGGVRGACSRDGGVLRPLYSH